MKLPVSELEYVDTSPLVELDLQGLGFLVEPKFDKRYRRLD
jgi:hypothetical protein